MKQGYYLPHPRLTQRAKTSVEHWNGSHWSLMTVLHGPTLAFMRGLTCPSTNRCFAIGETQRKKALVFRYA